MFTLNKVVLQLIKNVVDLQEGPADMERMTIRIGGKSSNNIVKKISRKNNF